MRAVNLSSIGRRLTDRWTEFRGFTPVDRNLFYLCIEIVPAGIAAGMIAFNGPFVLRLGGSDSLIGWMTSLPALMAILFSLPAAGFMERRTNRKPAIIANIGLARIAFLMIAAVPIVLPSAWQPYAIVGIVTLQAIFVSFFNAGWLSLMADMCPPDRRSTFFSTRWLLLAISVGVSSFLSGLWLDIAPFPLNYQTLNVLGFLGAQYSTWIISRANFPTYTVRAKTTSAANEPRKPRFSLAQFSNFARGNIGFVNLNLAVLVTFLGVWGAAPLLTLFFVNTLHVRDSWLGINTLVGQAGTMIGAIMANRILRHKSSTWLLRRVLLLFWAYPLLMVLVPIPEVIWGFSFIFILLDPMLNVSLLNVLYELIPEDRRSSWMSGHVVLMNIGAMISPLVIVEVANALTVQSALVLCAIIRLVGISMFWLLPALSHRRTQPVVSEP